MNPHKELQFRGLSLNISEGHGNTSSRGDHAYNKYLQWKWVCAAMAPTLTSLVIDTMSMEKSLVLPGESRVGSANAGTLPLPRNCCETTNWDGIRAIQFEDDYLATMEIFMNAIHLQNHKVPLIPRLTWDGIDMRIGHVGVRAKGISWIDFP